MMKLETSLVKSWLPETYFVYSSVIEIIKTKVMATRARIYKKLNENEYEGIYCHFDGYPSGLGEILREHYNTEEKVDELISMGDASYIVETIEESCFYHRDRNEDLNIIIEHAPLFKGAEYVYVFQDGKWGIV